jgi:hypothetical protein
VSEITKGHPESSETDTGSDDDPTPQPEQNTTTVKQQPMVPMICAENSPRFELKKKLTLYLSLHDQIDKCFVGTTMQNSVDKATLKENEYLVKEDQMSREQYFGCWDVDKLYDLQE